MHFRSFFFKIDIRLINVDNYVLVNAESRSIFVLNHRLNDERGAFIVISLTIDSKLSKRWICKCWRLRSFLNLKLGLSLIRICHLKFGESSFNNEVSLDTPKRKSFIFSCLRDDEQRLIFCYNELIYLSQLEGDFQRSANHLLLSIEVLID